MRVRESRVKAGGLRLVVAIDDGVTRSDGRSHPDFNLRQIRSVGGVQ